MNRNQTSYKAKAPLMWAIGGADPRAGAGIQADLQTANDLGVCCATIVTAVTAQSQRGVTSVSAVAATTLQAQLDTLLHDGEPLVIKIGLLCTQEQVEILAAWLSEHPVPTVLDPVIKASTGDALQCENVDLSSLYRHCVLLTPNGWELEQLGGIEKLRQARAVAVLVTGQRRSNALIETLYQLQEPNDPVDWQHAFIESKNDHGTGCCLASGIGAALACGLSLQDAITQAIAYVQHGLQADAIANTRASVAHRGYPGHIALWPRVARESNQSSP